MSPGLQRFDVRASSLRYLPGIISDACENGADVFLLNKILIQNLRKYPSHTQLLTLNAAMHSGPIFMGPLTYPKSSNIQMLEHEHARRILICFSGAAGLCLGLHWPVFFRTIAFQAEANIIIVRDQTRGAYVNGVGEDCDFECTLSSIRGMLGMNRFEPSEVIALGASMGSYGAMLYSSLLNIPRVICLAGPTSIGLGATPSWRDRKPFYSRLVAKVGCEHLRHLNAIDVIRSHSAPATVYYLYGERNEFDLACANHLKDHLGSRSSLHAYPTEDHAMIRFCIDDGILLSLIKGDL